MNTVKSFIQRSGFSKLSWQQVGGIDLRTLALFRIMLAICCIAQVIILWPDVHAFFDNSGLNPHAGPQRWQWAHEWDSAPLNWSLYHLSGNVTWTYTLFIITIGVNLALLLGYRTRIAIILSWILMVSLTYRVGIFMSGAQMQLRLLLFWAMFLPLGARFSVDAALYKGDRGNNYYLSIATWAILLQEAYLYFFGALQKTGPDWQTTWDAVYYVMNATHITSPLASLLGQSLSLTRALTLYTYYLELSAIFLLFSPVRTALCRFTVLPFLVALHLGFAVFMSIGFFPLVSITGLVVFVPALFWDRIVARFNAKKIRANITLYYDEDCGFCHKTCKILRELGLPSSTRIQTAQSTPEIHAILQRENSWVVEDGMGERRIRWDAVEWCWRRSALLWPLGILFLPRFMKPVGDYLYRFIAKHRGALGNFSAVFLAEHQQSPVFHLHKACSGLVAVLVLLVFIWNAGHLPGRSLGKYEPALHTTLDVFTLWQQWKYFAPAPTHSTDWVVIEGVLADGSKVDMLRSSLTPPSHARPANGYDAYRSQAWIRFFFLVSPHLYTPLSQHTLGNYFCSAWNRHYPLQQAEQMIFTEYRQWTPPPLAQPSPVKTINRFSYKCKVSNKN